MVLAAAERAVDIGAAAHEIESLAYVSACHQHLPVAFGVGIGIDYVISEKLLCESIGVVAPRLHHVGVGEHSAAGVLVGEVGGDVLRCGVIEVVNTPAERAVVRHHVAGLYHAQIHRRSARTAVQSHGKAVVGLPVHTYRR